MKTLLITLMLLLTGTSANFANHSYLTSSGNNLETTIESETKIIALRLYADWCGKCRALDPKVNEIKTSFNASEVLFTRFDFTDEFNTAQTKVLANRMNLSQIFDKYAGSTGTMLLIDAKSGEVLHEITHESSEEEIVAAIKSHI